MDLGFHPAQFGGRRTKTSGDQRLQKLIKVTGLKLVISLPTSQCTNLSDYM